MESGCDERAARELFVEGKRVRAEHALDGARVDAVDRGAGQHGMHAAGEDAARARVPERDDRVDERAGGVDDVVHDDDVAVLHVADDVQDLDLVLPLPTLVDDREARAEPLRERARALDAARVRRDDRERVEVRVADRVEENGRREQVVHGDVEEALNLRGMEVDAQNAVGARRHDEVGDELRRDRNARLVLAVLPRIAVVREHGGHARRRGALERVEHDEELHDVVIRRRARGLHDEHVRAPDVLLDLAVVLAVGEVVERDAAGLPAEVPADLAREGRMRPPPEDLQIAVRETLHVPLAQPFHPLRRGGGWGEPGLGFPQHERCQTQGRLPRAQGASEFGWGGRIRTSEWRFQRPLTYHLSTPHPEVPRGFSRKERIIRVAP